MIKFKIKQGPKQNLDSVLRWFEKLASDDMDKLIKRYFESAVHGRKLVALAKQIIQDEIYSYPESPNYERTKNLLNSWQFVVDSESDKFPRIAVFSGAPAEIEAGQYKGEFSYAAFFEEPGFDTFIKAPSPLDRKVYRPFMERMAEELHPIQMEYAERAFQKAMMLTRPRKGNT